MAPRRPLTILSPLCLAVTGRGSYRSEQPPQCLVLALTCPRPAALASRGASVSPSRRGRIGTSWAPAPEELPDRERESGQHEPGKPVAESQVECLGVHRRSAGQQRRERRDVAGGLGE